MAQLQAADAGDERGQVEEELRRLGRAVEQSIDGIAVADMRQPDNPLVYVNQAFTAMTGYPRELSIGFNCRFLQGPATNPEHGQHLVDTLRNYEDDPDLHSRTGFQDEPAGSGFEEYTITFTEVFTAMFLIIFLSC
mgnify:CR=1 FL=1